MRVLVLMGGVISLAAAAVLQPRAFKPSIWLNHTAAIVDTPRQVASLLDCARVCHTEYGNCLSITFNSNTGACTPRSRITYHPSNPARPAEEMFYYSEICNTNMGFRVYVYRSVIQCFFVSLVKANFTVARATCAVRNSTMIMIKSKDKLKLMQHFVASVTRAPTFVGLTDIEIEGKYVWEDSERAEKVAYSIPWARNQPDNWKNEDCVEIGQISKYFVNDIGCDELFAFICEKNIAP